MKKLLVFTCVTALALALSGCGAPAQPASTSSESEPVSVSDVPESSPDTSASGATSAVVQEETTVTLSDAATAEDAAKGAGIDKFGVMDKITANDTEFTNPTFAYAQGVAQALYEQGAMGIFVRKAKGSHEAPLTDRDKTEFANKWNQSYEGLDVTLYGAARGAATVFEWSDNQADYCVTFQGLGGEEVSMDSDEVAAIVKGFKEANATEEPKQEQQQTSEQQSSAQENNQQPDNNSGGNGVDNYLTEAEVQNIIWENGLGEYVSAQLIQANDGIWYWQAVTHDVNGKEHAFMVDPNGVVTEVTGDPSVEDPNSTDDGADGVDNNLTEAEVQNIIWENGLGQYEGAQLIQANDGVWYWQVTALDVNGDPHTFMVDPNGNVSEV